MSSITENDVNCKVVKLEAVDWPTKLQVLVDNGRPNTTPINPLRDGLKALFELMPEGTEMSLYVTAGTPRAIVKPTTDKQKLIDGIALVAPDGGAGMFFDALVGSRRAGGQGQGAGLPRDPDGRVGLRPGPGARSAVSEAAAEHHRQRHHDPRHRHRPGSGGTTGGQAQTEIGLNVTKMSGGRYEGISAPSRLATLLPEIGQKIAASAVKQRHQYRVTYERPDKPAAQPSIGATVRKEGVVQMSLRGNLP